MTVVSLRDLKRGQKMTPVQIRLPQNVRDKAKQMAREQSSTETKLTEADVYRTAILIFMSEISTDSRDRC